MSKKEPTVTKELPKSPNEFSYRGDELITITANEFLAIVKANEVAIKQGIETKFKAQPEWVSTVTGAIVVNPSQEDINSGIAIQVTSIEKTFSTENFQETFAAWLYPDIIQLKEMLLGVHKRQIEQGVAVPFSTLRAEYEAKQMTPKATAIKEEISEETPKPIEAPKKAVLKKV